MLFNRPSHVGLVEVQVGLRQEEDHWLVRRREARLHLRLSSNVEYGELESLHGHCVYSVSTPVLYSLSWEPPRGIGSSEYISISQSHSRHRRIRPAAVHAVKPTASVSKGQTASSLSGVISTLSCARQVEVVFFGSAWSTIMLSSRFSLTLSLTSSLISTSLSA